MKLLKKLLFGIPVWLWEKVFPPVEGTPCEVQAKEAGTIAIVPGRIYINVGKVVEINYQWRDRTMHSFASHQDNFIEQPSGIPLYIHDVGDLYSEKVKEGTEYEIGSESIYLINKSHIVRDMAEYEEELRQAGEFKWKKIVIIGLIVVIAFYLWKQGFITDLVGDVIPSSTPPEVINPMPPELMPQLGD